MKNLLQIIIAALSVSSLAPQMVQAQVQDTISVVKEPGVRHATAFEAAELMENHPEIIVLDVRTGSEFGRAHIRNAHNINYSSPQFKEHVAALDPDAEYLVHCQSGRRSSRAVKIMKAMGINHIIHLDGGFGAWKKAGLEIVEGE